MKQVSGTMKLDLAQFRELAAFAQFSSDLDKATKQRIERGRRLMEILKQPQYQPVPVEKQAMIMQAANIGALDEVPLDKVAEWETKFYRFMDSTHPEIGDEIGREIGQGQRRCPKICCRRLATAIEEYKQTFLNSAPPRRRAPGLQFEPWNPGCSPGARLRVGLRSCKKEGISYGFNS